MAKNDKKSKMQKELKKAYQIQEKKVKRKRKK